MWTHAEAAEVGVGVHAGPVGGGVTVGESHESRPVDRDRTTVIKEPEHRESDRTTVIKKENEAAAERKPSFITITTNKKPGPPSGLFSCLARTETVCLFRYFLLGSSAGLT
jgi:hypothetical protein